MDLNTIEITLATIIIVLIIVFFINILKNKQSNKVFSETIINLKKDNSKLKKSVINLESINNKLKKYEGILDAQKKADEILLNAREVIDVANFKSTEIVKKANTEADNIIIDATNKFSQVQEDIELMTQQIRNEKNQVKQENNSILSNATIEAGKIIEKADIRAKEIAGEAYEASRNVSNLEKTARAMKNVIKGYGDAYIFPSYSLLDELADEYGFEKAAKSLKTVREQAKLMVKHNTAARCDYVENNRKTTAINFVTDAFNGKVDTIISKLKQDNHGTLGQKVKDAYFLVNNLGKSFKNAIITEEYLNIRLEELHLGATVIELKNQEKEEQRIIKATIREEERARREFEKALKQTAKEEETLQKEIKKIQESLSQAQASEQQREKYEAKLQELAEKLKIAEEKGQRALSMAQQTKTGHVYIISNIGSFGENVYKIGMTRRLEPLDRVKELGDASVPFSFDVHAMILNEDAPNFEKTLHKKFQKMQMNKINSRKEFFKIPLKTIREEIDSLEIDVKWTMTAKAREYRETLAIERASEEK